MVVHWPSGIGDAGRIRSHYTHVNDVGATILDLAGIPMPDSIDGIEQQPFDGATFADSFADATAPERHTQQYYEILGNRGMYKDGWLLAQRLQRIPWDLDPEKLRTFGPGWNPDDEPVELYYLPDDFTQSKNIAADHPEKVRELSELFWAEAERNHVLPLLGGLTSFFGMVPPIPEESKFVFRGDIQNIPSGMIPRIYNHSYTISADLVVPRGRRRGRDRRRGRPSRRVRAVRAGRKAQAHLLDARRARIHPGGRAAAADRRGQRRARVHRRRAEAGDRRRGDAARQRRVGRERADGAHRAGALLRATPAWTSVATTASSSTAATPTRRPSPSPARSSRSCSTSPRDLSEEDAKALHEHAAQALAAHAASA